MKKNNKTKNSEKNKNLSSTKNLKQKEIICTNNSLPKRPTVSSTGLNLFGYKGVDLKSYVNKTTNSWTVKYQSLYYKDGGKIYLGTFDTPKEAAKAYNEYAKLIHGDARKAKAANKWNKV